MIIVYKKIIVYKESFSLNWYLFFLQEWKVGDRALAKWVDGKFYPAKITKKNDSGKGSSCLFDMSLNVLIIQSCNHFQ